MPENRRRWMRLVVDDAGRIDWQGYHLLTSSVPLRDFLDLEEMAQVAGDRKFAWDVYLQQHPEYLSRLRPQPASSARDREREGDGETLSRARRRARPPTSAKKGHG